jgi:hypothetical protein
VHDYAARNWLTTFIDHWLGHKPAAKATEAVS